MGDESNLVHRELSESVIGCAMAVSNRLKCGLPEKAYERALTIELRKKGHAVDPQKKFPIFYDGELIGMLIPDLLVDGLLIVDTKVVTAFADEHVSQMLGYLAITDLQLALLVNFRHPRVQWKRIVRQQAR